MMEILTPVNKGKVAELKAHYYACLSKASAVDSACCARKLREAEKALIEAVGIHHSLSVLGLLSITDAGEWDLKRIESKINDALEQQKLIGVLRRKRLTQNREF